MPMTANLLEARLVTHVLIQIPALIVAGYLVGIRVADRIGRPLAPYNRGGIPALLFAAVTALHWMIPRALDAALADPVWAFAKFTTLPLLVGVPLALGWAAAGPVTRALVTANAVSMLGALAWLYSAAPQRLCTFYLVDQQAELGAALLVAAGTTALLATFRLFLPSRRHR